MKTVLLVVLFSFRIKAEEKEVWHYQVTITQRDLSSAPEVNILLPTGFPLSDWGKHVIINAMLQSPQKSRTKMVGASVTSQNEVMTKISFLDKGPTLNEIFTKEVVRIVEKYFKGKVRLIKLSIPKAIGPELARGEIPRVRVVLNYTTLRVSKSDFDTTSLLCRAGGFQRCCLRYRGNILARPSRGVRILASPLCHRQLRSCLQFHHNFQLVQYRHMN